MSELQNKPFKVRLRSTRETYDVPADKSLLEVIRAQGVQVMTSCEHGICGTCITRVMAGEPEHRDDCLSAEERSSNNLMAVCCSRAKTDLLILDL